MPHIPEEIIEEIRSRANLVQLVQEMTRVEKRGNDYWACCPFHHEKTASFKINPERQNYYCFGCKKSGNVFSFVKETVNTDFVGAVRWLADRLGITIPESDEKGLTGAAAAQRRQWKDNCFRLLNDVAAWYHGNLNGPGAEQALSYIASRELDKEAVDHFMIGYSPDSWDAVIAWAKRQGYTQDQLLATGLAIKKENGGDCYDRFRGRLTFPIWDELGRVVGFSARVLEANAKTAKYVNSPETEFFQKGQLLYAYNFARQAFKNSGRALVCEGQLDVIACHRAGLTYAVAAQGTAFTEHHAQMLRRSTQNVTLAFDADTAGQKATVRTVALLHAQGLAVSVATLPDGDDPDSIFRRGGATALSAIMNATRPALHYLLEAFARNHDLSVPEERATVVQELLKTIQPIPDPVARAGHCQWLAQQLNLPENIVYEELKIVENAQARNITPIISPLPKVQKHDGWMKPFESIQPVNENALQTLLALILKFEPLALQLADAVELEECFKNTPVGEAVNTVLAHTQQGEWADAENLLASSSLSEIPSVGKVLAQNDFVSLMPQEGDSKEIIEGKYAKINQAFNDCIGKLQAARLADDIQKTKEELSNAPSERQHELQEKLSKLIIEKKRLLIPKKDF